MKRRIIGDCIAYFPMLACLVLLIVAEKHQFSREWVVPALFASIVCFIVGKLISGYETPKKKEGKPLTLGVGGNGRQGEWYVEIEEVLFSDPEPSPIEGDEGLLYNSVLEVPNYLIIENSNKSGLKRYEIPLTDDLRKDIDDLIAALQEAKKDFDDQPKWSNDGQPVDQTPIPVPTPTQG